MTGLPAARIAEAAGFWGLASPSEASALATNNLVWRCGDVWLKATSAGPARRERAIRITDQLSQARRFALPRALKTDNGRSIVEHAGFFWTAETALSGRHPDPNSARDYREAWAATSALHQALRHIAEGASESLIVQELRARIEEAQGNARCMAHAPIAEAAELLTGELEWIESWTAQTIHGDVSHPNILLSQPGVPGFIDFEFTSLDPIEFDFATLATTLLVRSNLDGQTRERVLTELIQFSGLDPARLLLAILARRWLAVVANLTYDDGPNPDVLRRQLQHFEAITPLAVNCLVSNRRSVRNRVSVNPARMPLSELPTSRAALEEF